MNHSIETLRRQAKTLRKAYESGETAALQRLAVHPPRSSGELKHADFLHVISREAGFANWPDLKLACETHGLDHAQKLERLKIALYNGQHAVIERLLAEIPNLAEGKFALQVSLLNLPVVSAMLAEEPSQATTWYGPRRPILHLAFSRQIHAHPEREADMLAIAELLVRHGADVNDSCPVSQVNENPLSVLYGAIGHSNNMPLARWLLEHGADANDGESLYHSTELGHREGLKLLLEHRADPKGTNALLRAMDFHDHEAVQLLLSAGARADDYVGEPVGGETPWVIPALHQAARRQSDTRMITLLLEGGADPERFFEGTSVYGYARVNGNATLAQALEAHGVNTILTPEEVLLAKAADNISTNAEYIDTAQLPEVYRSLIREMLHLPDKLGHVQRLVAIGLEYDRPDSQGVTPVQVAGWAGLPEMMGYLLSLKPDLSHVNNYGATLLSTIVHGSENCPERASRDHLECVRLALAEGVALPIRTVEYAGNPALADFLTQWAEAHPGQVVQGG